MTTHEDWKVYTFFDVVKTKYKPNSVKQLVNKKEKVYGVYLVVHGKKVEYKACVYWFPLRSEACIFDKEAQQSTWMKVDSLEEAVVQYNEWRKENKIQ